MACWQCNQPLKATQIIGNNTVLKTIYCSLILPKFLQISSDKYDGSFFSLDAVQARPSSMNLHKWRSDNVPFERQKDIICSWWHRCHSYQSTNPRRFQVTHNVNSEQDGCARSTQQEKVDMKTNQASIPERLTELSLYVPLDTKQVILEMFFAANLLA